jgi:micrococcal nuclease
MFALAVGITGLSTGGMPNLGSPSSASSTALAIPSIEHLVAGALEATPVGALEAAADLGAGPNGTVTRAKVVRVIDGNTILVAFGGKRHEVRYLGLSTPAAVGRRAKAVNAHSSRKSVVLEADVSGVDRSGRLLRYVWVQQGSRWTLVNLELVRRGLAKVASRSSDKKYAGEYVAAEARARDRQLGVWAPGPKAKPPKASKSPKPATPPVNPVPSDHR